jgi:hypothetical protein
MGACGPITEFVRHPCGRTLQRPLQHLVRLNAQTWKVILVSSKDDMAGRWPATPVPLHCSSYQVVTSGHAEQAWLSTDRTRGQMWPVSAHAGCMAPAVSRCCRTRRRPWAAHGRDRGGMPRRNASPMTCGISFCEDANSVMPFASRCWSRVETRAYPILIAGPYRKRVLALYRRTRLAFTILSCGNRMLRQLSADDRLRNTSRGYV